MLDLRQGLARNHVYSSDPISRINGNYDRSSAINFSMQTQRTAQNYRNYADRGGGGIEFRAHTEDESGVTSPPLWKTSPPTSPPTESTPLYHSPHKQHHHYHILSPTSRTQAIARGKQELMEMVKNMPESCYELSLRDLIEQPTAQGFGQATVAEEKELTNGTNIRRKKEKKKNKKKNDNKAQMVRSGSMDNGAFLLKMFFPTSLGQKKKNSSTTGICSKVSPRPSSVEGEKVVDKEWWKKRFTPVGDSKDNGSASIGGSSGSSNSSRRRKMGGFLPSCWSFFYTNKSKPMKQKGSLF